MSSDQEFHSPGERRPVNTSVMSFLQISARYLGYDELPGTVVPYWAERNDAASRAMAKEASLATLR